MVNRKFRWIPPVLWGLLITILSVIPGGAGNLNFLGIPNFDKVGHFGMYAIWTFLFVLALSDPYSTSGKRALWTAVFIGTITGVGLEFGQYFMRVGRSFEIWDMVANTCGAIVGALAGSFFNKIRSRAFAKK